MKPLLIVKAGDALPSARERGEDFETWIARGFGGALPTQVFDARSGTPPAPPSEWAGVAVTGSAAMVTDRLAWSEALLPWLRTAVAAEIPVLGICYGHQLLAHALGGEVAYHPQGMEIGTVTVSKTAAAAEDALFVGLPDAFPAQAVHSQSVRRLPAGAVCLAANDFEAHQAVRYGVRAWGVQFHPEFDPDALAAYLDRFSDQLTARGIDPQALRGRLQSTDAAASILRRFAALAIAAAAEPVRKRA